jgi:mRNA interferase HicA
MGEVRRRDLIAELEALGWFLLREGGNHSIYAHADREHHIAVPRHREINEHTARGILRDARR